MITLRAISIRLIYSSTSMKPESGILLMCLLAMSNVSADTFVSDDIITSPQPDHFSVCYNNTCTTVQDLSLTQQQWQRVREAHLGFQLGLELYGLLPLIGHKAGFYDLRVNDDLTITIPAVRC